MIVAAFDPTIASQFPLFFHDMHQLLTPSLTRDTEHSGSYLDDDCQIANDRAAPYALDGVRSLLLVLAWRKLMVERGEEQKNAERLWELSNELLGENF